LTIRGTVGGVQVKLDKPTRQTPSRIVLHLPENRPLETATTQMALAEIPLTGYANSATM